MRFVAFVTVTLVAATANADRIGFANAARDGAAGRTAIEAMRAELAAAGKLEPLADGVARRSLEEPLDPADDPAARAVAAARARLADAKDLLTRFEHDVALARLREAETILRAVAPTADVVAALADVAFTAGLVHAGRKDDARAFESFRLVHRLAPERKAIDPGTYKPQLVELYADAGKEPAETGVAEVTTEPSGATVWVDGRVLGAAPMELSNLAVGDHYVAATIDGHAPRVERLRVEAGKRVQLPFLLSRLPADERARAIRASLALRGEGGDWKRAAAVLADVASVDVLVVVRQTASETLEAAVYDARARALGPWIEAGDVRRLATTLPRRAEDRLALPTAEEIARRKAAGGAPLGPDTPRPGPATPWYKTTRFKVAAAVAAGVIVVGGGIALISDTSDDTQTYFLDLGDVGWK